MSDGKITELDVGDQLSKGIAIFFFLHLTLLIIATKNKWIDKYTYNLHKLHFRL